MKKSILLFVIGATTLAAGLVGCKTKECENPTGFSGTFNGTHKVFIGAADLAALNLVTPIADVIVGSVSGTSVTIGSDILPIDLTGTISASNSNIVNLDSLITGVNEILAILLFLFTFSYFKFRVKRYFYKTIVFKKIQN